MHLCHATCQGNLHHAQWMDVVVIAQDWYIVLVNPFSIFFLLWFSNYFDLFLVGLIFDYVSFEQAARVGFCAQINRFSDIERGTSITISRGVDLARAALQIAAEDDSIISHSSVPLPVDDFIERLDSLSMGYCSHYSSSFRSSPENFLDCLERYLYLNKVS